ncbi:hypothetical protein BKA70DRAFT_1262996 [Coprinopsis sp. MPI-PUGE-AT-0042]|nr:hypothetical protein BKA70DRAFT_1262996 [Coprinopsis sp. MPI-PUGE-AT-0042]
MRYTLSLSILFLSLIASNAPAAAMPQYGGCDPRNCYVFGTTCNEISHPVYDNGCWRCCLNTPRDP